MASVYRSSMPIKTPRTDRATLNALLVSTKLSTSERKAFQQMFDDLVGGKVISLSKKQRLWADSVYEHHNLSEVRAAARKEARANVQATKVYPWELEKVEMKPRTGR